MSYRGKKPHPTGQGRRDEAEPPASSVASGPMQPPTVDYGAVNSLGFPIAIGRQVDIREGLGDITSRLNRALGQYENVFDEEDKEGKGSDSTTDGQADGIMMGVRNERREFESRYETITARVDAMERERTELMNSMAQWLEVEPVQWIPTADEGPITDDTPPQEAGRFRDQLLNTKMGFEKLKQMDHEKERLNNQGKDTEHLQEASSNLQMKVIKKFKKLYETKKLAATRRSFGAHWKHASEEIVGLLQRIRSEGTDSIDALEEQLEKAMNAIERQAEEMMRLEGQIREKEEMVEKWSKENAKLTNENLLLDSEKEKCRDIAKKLKKALIDERRKKGTATTEADVNNIAEGKVTQKLPPSIQQHKEEAGFRRNLAGRDVKGDGALCRICRRRVESGVKPERTAPTETTTAGLEEARAKEAGEGTSEDLAALQEDNDWLNARVAHLEQKLIEKETQMMKLEMQLSELMEAIQTSSPHIIQTLSLTDPSSLSSLVRLTGDKPPAGSTQQTEGCSPAEDDAHGQGFGQTPLAAGKETSNLAVPRMVKPSSKKSVKKRAGEQQPIKQPSSQSDLAQTNTISLMMAEHNTLQEELVKVKSQLMRAQRELITLKYASSAPPVSMGTGRPRQVKGTTGEHSSHGVSADSDANLSTTKVQSAATAPQTAPNVPKSQAVVTYDDEFAAYAELIHKDQISRPSRRMSRPSPIDEGGTRQRLEARQGDQKEGQTKQVSLQTEDYLTYDQGMQTDPQMDPLGQWSNVPSLKKRRTDPLPIVHKHSSTDTLSSQVPIVQPPTEWTHFDPTGPITPATASISLQMRAGKEPASLQTGGIVEYVDRELSRIVQGINGFTSYLKRLIQREVTDIIKTNQDIRRHLSEVTLRKLDQGAKDNAHPSPEAGRKSRALATPIRRGRFEVIKDYNSSKFATKNAYASLQSGGRRFFHSASPIPPWNFHSKTPTPLPAEYTYASTFAHNHISMADEMTVERYLASPHDTICSLMQHQVGMIGQHAIHVLKGTTVFFKEIFTRQMEEYNTLHGAFGIRQELKTLMASSPTSTEKKDDTMESGHGTQADVSSDHAQLPYDEPPLKLARSTSHNSFLQFRNITYIQEKKHVDFDFKEHPKVYPLETQSLSSIQSSHCYLPALALYDKQTPRNRHEMAVPKATLPRRGQVTLQVKKVAVKMDAKVSDTKRRSRPVAVSHRGLLSRQREVLAKQGTPQNSGEQELPTTTTDLKRQILQLQANQLSQATDQSNTLPMAPDNDTRKTLPPIENERRRVIIHAQDQLRNTVHQWDKYAKLLSD